MWDWLNQNKEWVFSGIGVLALAWILKWLFSSLLREPATSPGNTVTQSPSLTQSPSITVSPTIHLTPSQAPVEPPKQPRPVAIPRSRSNLICVGPETVRVLFNSNDKGEEYFYRTDDQGDQDGSDAVVAWFRNEPGAGARGIQQVRVNIIYRDSSGKEIGAGLPRASWLEDNGDVMDFYVGDSHAVILVLRRPGGDLSNIAKKWRRADDGMGNVITADIYPLHEGLRTIELRVLSENGDSLMEPVRFSFFMVKVQGTDIASMAATRI